MSVKKYLDATGLAKYHGNIKAYIANQIASVGHLKREVVTALPSVADADAETIYLVKRASAGQNASDTHDEYMLINGAFELIGNTEVSFAGYSTTAEVEAKISAAKGEAITAAAADATAKANAALAAANSYTETQIAALDTTQGIPTEDIDALFS